MSAKKKEKASVPTTMAIGAFAGAASKTAVAPLERVRLLLQMAPARGEGSRSASSGFSAVMRSEGVLGLWRGNGLSIIRAMLSKGILFSSQDVLAGKLSPDTSLSPSPSPGPNASPIHAQTPALTFAPTLTLILTFTLTRQARLRHVGWRRCGATGGWADLPTRPAAYSASGDCGRRDVG